MPVTISECPGCKRLFIPRNCPYHCTMRCCKASGCASVPAARVPGRHPGRPRSRIHQPIGTPGRCAACGLPHMLFERFAPCTDNCKGSVYWQSSRGEQGFTRTRTFACHLYPERMAELHAPDTEPRIHVLYCSLRCYNSAEYGHEARRSAGIRRRNRRYRGSLAASTPRPSSYGEELAAMRRRLRDEGVPWLQNPA